jgi:nickel-dependent lactate racemase
VNRLLLEADLVLGIGQVGVHAIMGWSGGAKIVHPGVSGAATEAWTHWEASWHPTEALLGDPGNPIRREIEEGARKAGLAAVLNVVLDAQGRIQHAAYGDPVHAQRACAQVARLTHETRVGEPADVVVTDSRPADRDYWQSAKGLYGGTVAVKEGGSIVMASPNPEGVAGNHPELLDLAGLPLDEIRDRVAQGRVHDVIAAAVAAYTARIRERSDVHLVSSGIPAEQARRLGFTPHESVQSALDDALRKAGPRARVAILDGAGGLLPRVRGRNDHLGASLEHGGVRA